MVFLSDVLLIFYASNTVKNTPSDLSLEHAAFEGYKWPWNGTANTVPRVPTWGVRAKSLLGSANTVQCKVRLG